MRSRKHSALRIETPWICGTQVPDVMLDAGFGGPWVSLREKCAGKKTIVVGLPGAFTPT